MLSNDSKRDIRDWTEQLISQNFLARVGEYNTLQITDTGWQLLKGELVPRLLKPQQKTSSSKSSKQSLASWEGVDRELFEKLKTLRGKRAAEQQVPAYVVFNDASLRDMARRRPSTLEKFRLISGVGQKKLEDYGEAFLAVIVSHCEAVGIEMDFKPSPPSSDVAKARLPGKSALSAFPHFEAGLSVADTARELGRAESTTMGYLGEYIQHKGIVDYTPWVDEATGRKIEAAIGSVGFGPLKPIFLALNEEVDYNKIRIVQSCLVNRQPAVN